MNGELTRQPDECISLYVPARNAEPTLAACIEAIRGQSRPPDELLLLVDPRSSDRTVAIARGTGARVIEQRGPTLGSARNEAIQAARYRWLACCDSDVLPEHDWLARLAERRGQGAVGIGGRTVEHVRNPFDEWRALHMPHHWGEYPLRNPFMLVSEALFDRQALLAAGGYRDDMDYHEDSDLCRRLRDAGYDLFYEPSALATHQRTDTLLSVLTLRWKYAEHRQRHLMDRFAGLIDKCRVNREYALNTLSRSLARGREELAYISFLLFFHHLAMDLRSMLSRRPLIPAPARASYLLQLVAAVEAIIAEHHPDLSCLVRADLNALAQPAVSGHGDPEAPPAWAWYLGKVQAEAGQLCVDLSDTLLAIMADSARYVHNHLGAQRLARLPAASPATLRAAVEAIPIAPFVDEAFCRAVRAQWPDLSGIRVVGRLAREEQTVLNPPDGESPDEDARTVALAAHLEARSDPLGVFDGIAPHVGRLVVCYQSPARFVPGLDIPSASDLASAAAAAGWTIEKFDTLIGRTRLMLSRPPHTHHVEGEPLAAADAIDH